ncbi:hypothetical protein HRI_002227700 [Hibiscus trionum]|uniref:Retrotransposon gag domain-containing protein n=1 Tax=Hibiscus trionum TaxID=183268 RepID=A0A9W7HXS0_HIBTR|nr:hypothetical protein HRI_002227700 [Hibiscus trionum]
MARDGESTAVKKSVGAQAEKAKRGSSKDAITSMQGKVSKLEESMAEVKVVMEQLEPVNLDKLGSLDLEKLESLEGIQDEVQKALNGLDLKMVKCGDSLEATMVALRKEVEELKESSENVELRKEVEEVKESSENVELNKEVEFLKTELLLLKAAIGNSVAIAAPKAVGDIPKPKKIKGTRSTQEVENFLWRMEQYFKATCIERDAKKVSFASIYLTDLAQTWWRRRCGDVKRRSVAIETWKEFQDEIKEQFYSQYDEDEARSKLRRLRQEDAKFLRDHVRKFMELSLQVPSLSEEDGFFTFTDGLQPWVKMELQR